MAQLRLLCFYSSSSISFSSNSISLLAAPNSSSRFPHVSLSLSPLSPSTSLSLRQFSHHFHPIFCSASSTLIAETPALESTTEDDFSRTRLVAQNIPWTSTVDDIRALFQNHGKVIDVELSMYNKTRNRGLAFVEMGSPEEAIEALRKLEAHEFEGRTLKLNYARPRKKKPSPPVQPKRPLTYNLFVTNLPFVARGKDLRDFFGSGGSQVVSAEVIFHDNPRRSSGYGFVSFATKKEAEAAFSTFQGKELMGRPVRVARSRRFVKLETEMTSQSDESGEFIPEHEQPENAHG
ncbi:hypothetical protein Ancab_038381 [Ancistrocladus abbreviatus]